MRKILLAATALALAPLGIAAAQTGTGTAGTGRPGNETGAVDAASKPGGTAGALPNTAARLDSANRSSTRDSTRRSRNRSARRNRSGAARRDSAAALIPGTPGSTPASGTPAPSGAPPR